jgi:hypothetical protein
MSRWKTWGAVAILAVLAASCSAATPIEKKTIAEQSYQSPVGVGSERIIERSNPQMPGWALRLPEHPSFYYYIGAKTDAWSLSLGQDLTYMNALLKLVRSLGVVYAVEGQAQFTNLGSFYDQSIEGVPLLALTRRAEIEELYFVKKEVVRDTFGGEPSEFDIIYDVWVKVRYPKAEWTRFQQEFGAISPAAEGVRRLPPLPSWNYGQEQPDLPWQIGE